MEIFSFSSVIFYSAFFFQLSFIMFSKGSMEFLLLRGWPMYGRKGLGYRVLIRDDVLEVKV